MQRGTRIAKCCAPRNARRRDFGHLDTEMTFEDPQMYTRPFTIKIPHNLLADADIFEDFC
jgi:hypothetical protein